ncbi:MAG: prepilin-type N-terminal cleavage/methylation domain-containing protein [Hydrogenophaga sp.]|uniref:type II secretion system protein n=1 Tax=Hydrogenophaga sp. TaxID=1904254 RepID=UPI002ABBC550|nr:prepilin-type N-terminal cleavage/methylation domain-containing protein [Hydrogenophaga sp.]MDZ4101021.1 prepilin-type N-terminal cleavage/methylation domain-containing protein [Hydrogenophaga sp.]
MSQHTASRCEAPGTTAPDRLRSQRGLSLIEMALALTVVGVLMGMALKSQELVEQYRQSQFVSQVQALIANARAHQGTLGRWPGDCNRDGLVDYSFDFVDLTLGMSLDYGAPTTLDPATATGSPLTYVYEAGNVCPNNSLVLFEEINVPFNELKRGGYEPASEPNRKTANHGLGGFAYLGTFSTGPAVEQRFNALVLTDVSIQGARRLANAIDGNDGSAANTGRVRRVKVPAPPAPLAFEALWTTSSENELARVPVVVYFDRIPP